MSRDWVEDIEKMNEKFSVLETVRKIDKANLFKLMEFRLSMTEEEMTETMDAFYLDGIPEEIVDGLIDLMVFNVQTLLMFGVCPNTAWDRVLEKNMQKEPGVKPERPNCFGFPDLIKPEGWVAPDHSDNVGIIPKVFEEIE